MYGLIIFNIIILVKFILNFSLSITIFNNKLIYFVLINFEIVIIINKLSLRYLNIKYIKTIYNLFKIFV